MRQERADGSRDGVEAVESVERLAPDVAEAPAAPAPDGEMRGTAVRTLVVPAFRDDEFQEAVPVDVERLERAVRDAEVRGLPNGFQGVFREPIHEEVVLHVEILLGDPSGLRRTVVARFPDRQREIGLPVAREVRRGEVVDPPGFLRGPDLLAAAFEREAPLRERKAFRGSVAVEVRFADGGEIPSRRGGDDGTERLPSSEEIRAARDEGGSDGR